jgi:hypothetical protein
MRPELRLIAATCAAFAHAGFAAAQVGDGSAPEAVLLPAVDGVFAAFEARPLVGLGDDHGMAKGMAFYAAIVRDPRFAREVGNVVVEFGAAGRQDVIDRYVAGEAVPYAELRTVWTDTVGWIPTAGILGFAEFFAAVRETNQALPPDERIRVWLGEPPIDWSTATREDFGAAMSQRDGHPAGLIVDDILAEGEKALVIYGGFHYASGETGPGARSLLGRVEAEHPDAFYLILPFSGVFQPPECAPFAERAAQLLPAPALAAAPGGAEPGPDLKACATLDAAALGMAMAGAEPPVVEADAVVFHGPVDTLARGPSLPDLYLDREYRLAIHARSEVGAIELPPFPPAMSLRRADYDIELDAPGFAEAVDAMFAAHDDNGDGVVTADEFVDPIQRSTTPDPVVEAILRRLLDALAEDPPVDDRLSAALTQVSSGQQSMWRQIVTDLGEIQDVTVIEAGPTGGVFDMAFADGAVTYSIVLDADGRLVGLRIARQAPSEEP